MGKLTHLNPKANNLKQFEKDCISLKNGKTVICREYDHETGKFTYKKKIRKKDFVLIIGLHSLYCQKVRNITDISIFLDVNENLRKYFKINRDIKRRKHKKKEIIHEIKRRKKDSDLYIKKQKKYADIIFQINSLNEKNVKKEYNNEWVETKIKFLIKKEINTSLLKNVISKIFKNFKYKEEKNYLSIELNSKDMILKNFKSELKKISKNLEEILAISPNYMDKEHGIMQFIVLFFIFDRVKLERKKSKLFYN